jgi:hypothetical protein
MPLVKSASPAAFKANVRREYKAIRGKGKAVRPAVKQAVAIAFSVQRRARGRGR